AQSNFAIRTASSVAFSILYYDYILTLQDEVERYWGSKVSAISVLFFINRYLSLFAHIPVIIEFYGTHSEMWALIKTWQSGNSRTPNYTQGEGSGCDLTMSQIQGQYLAAIWACVLVFDAVVFVLTLARVLYVGKTCRGSLFTVMQQDGAMYFGILFICHLSNILTCLQVYRGISVTATNVIASSMISRLMLNIRDPELSSIRLQCSSDVPNLDV
ncbi:hypothetical protein OH77DRAFT_1410658, partial [Trametes cingulata]